MSKKQNSGSWIIIGLIVCGFCVLGLFVHQFVEMKNNSNVAEVTYIEPKVTKVLNRFAVYPMRIQPSLEPGYMDLFWMSELGKTYRWFSTTNGTSWAPIYEIAGSGETMKLTRDCRDKSQEFFRLCVISE